MKVRRLRAEDEQVAADACRLSGADGDLDPAGFLSRVETALLIAEDELGTAGWVYGHQLVHPDGEKTMILYAMVNHDGSVPASSARRLMLHLLG
jgi:hypothetical protein